MKQEAFIEKPPVDSLSALRAEREILLNSIEDAYMELDLKGSILFVNDAYCRMFERTREQVFDPSYNYKNFYDAARRDFVRGLFKKVYQTGEPVRAVEFEFAPAASRK